MYSLALIIFVVSEKRAFEHFPIGSNNAFFSETTNMIKAKLYMNVHWMVLYNLKVFCSDMEFKMAATFLGSLVSIVQVVSEKKRFEIFFP
jgi:hypothetical protein